MIDRIRWTIDPETTQVVVFNYPDKSLTQETVAWLDSRGFSLANVRGACIQHVDRARNQTVKELVLKLPDRFTDIIFIDRDMRPGESSDYFLTLDTDIAGCRYKTRDDNHWADPEVFHCGLVRFRRKVFQSITAPWFRITLSADGCNLDACECRYFLEKAKQLGFTSSHAGWAEHDNTGSWAH